MVGDFEQVTVADVHDLAQALLHGIPGEEQHLIVMHDLGDKRTVVVKAVLVIGGKVRIDREAGIIEREGQRLRRAFEGQPLLLHGGGQLLKLRAVLLVIRTEDVIDGEILHDLRRAADVILVVVGQDEVVDLGHAVFLQTRDHLLAVALLAAVDDDGVVRRLQDHAVRLADLHEGDGQGLGGGSILGRLLHGGAACAGAASGKTKSQGGQQGCQFFFHRSALLMGYAKNPAGGGRGICRDIF